MKKTGIELPVAEGLPDLIAGTFVKRINRFVALVEVKNKRELAHVPSSGRMGELLVPGVPVFLAPARGRGRKTAYSLLLVSRGNILVSIDSLLPNKLVRSGLARGEFPELDDYRDIYPEYAFGNSRFDFFLAGPGGGCFIEVKSVTLVEKGVAMFPDAPSLRGVKHLEELQAALESGYRAAVIFVVQREDGRCFRPNEARDPAFARALRRASSAGVNIYAYRCKVLLDKVVLGERISVFL